MGGGLDHGDVEVLATLRSRPLPPFTLASPTVAESLMAPHALRQLTALVHRRRAHQRRPAAFLPLLSVPVGGTSHRRCHASWLACGQILLFLKNSVRILDWRDVRGCSCVPIPSNASAAEPIKSKRRAFLPAGDRGRPRDAISFDEFLLAVAGCRQSAGPQWSFRRRILNRGMHLRV